MSNYSRVTAHFVTAIETYNNSRVDACGGTLVFRELSESIH